MEDLCCTSTVCNFETFLVCVDVGGNYAVLHDNKRGKYTRLAIRYNAETTCYILDLPFQKAYLVFCLHVQCSLGRNLCVSFTMKCLKFKYFIYFLIIYVGYCIILSEFIIQIHVGGAILMLCICLYAWFILHTAEGRKYHLMLISPKKTTFSLYYSRC